MEPLSRKAIDLLLQHGADRLTVLHHPDLGAVCRGFGVATELLSEILKPEFPRLDLLRSHELDVGAAQVIAEIFQVNDGLESVCGISPGQMEVNLAGQNLTDASMRLLSTEKRVVQSLDLSSNPSISDDGIRLLGRMDHLRELSMQACSGWGGSSGTLQQHAPTSRPSTCPARARKAASRTSWRAANHSRCSICASLASRDRFSLWRPAAI